MLGDIFGAIMLSINWKRMVKYWPIYLEVLKKAWKQFPTMSLCKSTFANNIMITFEILVKKCLRKSLHRSCISKILLKNGNLGQFGKCLKHNVGDGQSMICPSHKLLHRMPPHLASLANSLFVCLDNLKMCLPADTWKILRLERQLLFF